MILKMIMDKIGMAESPKHPNNQDQQQDSMTNRHSKNSKMTNKNDNIDNDNDDNFSQKKEVSLFNLRKNMKQWLILLFIAVIVANEILRYFQIVRNNTIDTTIIKQPKKIYQIDKLQQKQLKQLPFCLLFLNSIQYSHSQLQSSIEKQQYSNYIIIQLLPYQVNNYYTYKQKLKAKCIENSVIMFLNSPLKAGALRYMNEQMQILRVWAIYSESLEQNSVEVHAFLYRIYDLLDKNDFRRVNTRYLTKDNPKIQTLLLLDLCSNTTKKVQKSLLFQSPQTSLSYFTALTNISTRYQFDRYQKLARLSQDHNLNVGDYEFRVGRLPSDVPPTQYRVNLQQMYRALQRQDFVYLPTNHTINQLEYQEYNRKYSISQYMKNIQKQVRFCVTIMSRNNIPNNRYTKILDSILKQDYENYHIVFIDDVSTDQTLNFTVRYLRERGFPGSRVQFVRNLERNYATYNIFNAAYNYCGETDVQMLLDGDDEVVGKYAFQVLSSGYQNKDQGEKWVVFSSYKTNLVSYGRSWIIDTDDYIIDKKTGGRKHLSFLGPIRTWRVQLLYHITLPNNLMKNGNWLDTGYDDALIHPLVSLATLKKFTYIPELLYEYNREYGDNDDSNAEKVRHRYEVYEHLAGLPLLGRVEKLEGSVRDREIAGVFGRDRGVRYETYKV